MRGVLAWVPMCGFVGFLTPAGLGADAAGQVRAMADRLAHRGPDDEGVWLDGSGRVAFGHRRLSIVDLATSVMSLA